MFPLIANGLICRNAQKIPSWLPVIPSVCLREQSVKVGLEFKLISHLEQAVGGSSHVHEQQSKAEHSVHVLIFMGSD